jgi:hypothetical protein
LTWDDKSAINWHQFRLIDGPGRHGLVTQYLLNSGVREVGEQFERGGPNGIKERWTVIWRKIGPMYGVEMGLRNENGKILSGEFFD